MEATFKNLFSPLELGPVTVSNRIFLSNVAHRFYAGNQAPNDRVLGFYEARAKGGVGLIITGPHCPAPLTTARIPTAYQDDRVIPELKKQADTIHQYGTKVFAQLEHVGNYSTGRSLGGGATWSPSATPRRNLFASGMQEIGHPMEQEDLRRFIDDYAAAAKRIKKSGYDGIEIMAMYGLLHAQFLSPASNLRSDAYGGNFNNRLRFLLETIAAVRDAIGPELALGVRYTADEFVDQVWWSEQRGYNLDEGKKIAQILTETGELDYLFPCAPSYGPAHVPPMNFPLGAFVYLSAEIKAIVDLPVFGVGRINDPTLADRIVADHQADMIGISRGLIADPEFPKKAREGRVEEIRKCVGCNEGCVGGYFPRLPLCCSMNAEAGRERDLSLAPAKTPKRVMVVGGGAAGLETARVAAARGHRVRLYEKNNTLGSELMLAAKAPGREGFQDAQRYFAHQMDILGVDVRLNTTVTAGMADFEAFDAVVVATGALPFIPRIKGADGADLKLVEMRQVLHDELEIGDRIVVADYENHLYGLDTAEFLARRGKQVELLNESIYAGGMVDYHSIHVIYENVLRKGVVLTPLSAIKEIRGAQVVVYNLLTDAEKIIEDVDAIVVCSDGRPNDGLYQDLKGKVGALYAVGQCLAPRKMLDSIYDGYCVGAVI
jgi:2,4-dienoyl-CoA reductase-like NADH-dependent reductase (Old Yellow Enzyme family)/thioredoxin reductase